MPPARTKLTDDGLPVRSFRTLLADIATIARSTVGVKPIIRDPVRFEKIAQPVPLQQRAMDLLGAKLVAQTVIVMAIRFISHIDILRFFTNGTSD
jgi:hypothetical protein